MMRRPFPSPRSGLLVFLLVVAGLAASAAPASGHASYLGSDPAPGERLDRTPRRIVLRFTEPLNRSLSAAALYDVASGRRIAARLTSPVATELAVFPIGRVSRAPYRVEWHSVSADDGHALEGSFSFGVRSAAVPGASSTEASPLADGGWLRVAARALLYPTLFVFAGALLLDALLPRCGGRPWIVPATGPAARGAPVVLRRYRSIVVDAGWLAAALATSSALIDAYNAAGRRPRRSQGGHGIARDQDAPLRERYRAVAWPCVRARE
jgi:methionine-rich copper-binding protein CopC